MAENVYCRRNKGTNPVFRENWDEIFKESVDLGGEESSGELSEGVAGQIKKESEKGKVTGHFC